MYAFFYSVAYWSDAKKHHDRLRQVHEQVRSDGPGDLAGDKGVLELGFRWC